MNGTDGDEEVSKTRRKREMLARQDIGEALVALSEAQLDALHLPERLLDAVVEAKRISKFGALRRQLQYIGRLMRDVDADAISAQLEAWKGQSRETTVQLHQLERWRERLIESDAALTELAGAHAGIDVQRLRQLVRSARRERSEGSAPAAYRALFQALKSIVAPAEQAPRVQQGGTADAPAEPES